MRYYAGNWAYNIWLVRKGSAQKFDKLKKAADTVYVQLAKFVPDPVQLEVAKTMMCVSRFMHFEGRALLEALPRAVDDIDDYEWHEGELIGGMVLGWNFGDGHLNGEQLLRAIQPQCGFTAGEVRVVSVESQPLFGPTMHWRVYDAVQGLDRRGAHEARRLRRRAAVSDRAVRRGAAARPPRRRVAAREFVLEGPGRHRRRAQVAPAGVARARFDLAFLRRHARSEPEKPARPGWSRTHPAPPRRVGIEGRSPSRMTWLTPPPSA